MQQLDLAPALSRRDHSLALLWLLVFTVCISFCVYKVTTGKPFHSNLLQLLPKDERNPILHDLSLLLAERFQDKLLILVQSDDVSQGLKQTRDLQRYLLSSSRLAMDNPSQSLQQELIKLYQPFSQQLLSREKRQWLQTHTPEQLAEQTYRELFNPVALPRPYSFAEDPFNVGGDWLVSLTPRLKLQDYQGFPLVHDVREGGHSWLMISAVLKESPFDVAVQQDVTNALAAFYQSWPNAQVLTSGMIFHAAAGTKQATAEINTVGLGSMIGIITLVLLVFRRVTPLIAVLLTMTSAYTLALTTSLLVFGQIHIITLAFGSTLLGVAGDYVLHFLVGSQREGSGLAARHHLRYAMAIGALTGIGAYLLQFTTPFPGLQQMAIFCSAGILGAWLTVLALSPYYRVTPNSARAPLFAAEHFYRLGENIYRPLWARIHWVYVLLFISVVFSLIVIIRGGTNDAVINLNTSPKALLEAEHQLQEILQQPSVSRFFFIEANSPEQLLIRTQALNEKLAELHEPDLRWQSLQQYLPSQAQQRADRQLIMDKLYSAQGALALVCQKLGAQCQAPVLQEAVLGPADIKASKLAAFLPPLIQAEQNQAEQHWYSVVTLSGTSSEDRLLLQAAGLEGIRLINQTTDLSQLLGRYRASVSSVLLATLVVLALGLAIRYRHRGWRMLLPLVIAMLFALGCAAVEGITLFHVMALLLVIGIGLDTAVFYTEGGFNAESWLASSLACCTSILAFGLLSLSAVPVLHQFGLIILVGILSCWLLTPLFFRPSLVPDVNMTPEFHNR